MEIIYQQVDTVIVSNQGVRHMLFSKAIGTVILDLWPLNELPQLLALPLLAVCMGILLSTMR
jgi:hypothetical protein